ncbi:histone deacetylase like protein [Zymoseptoria brevis]|uniref:Histone deacetylase n=1 Tax=Zymoseptoria brevis TaxID=1047168 RepID=A0A0F4GJE9_9PEZI|nr:histone deacetylase like protein [Zymoseptoria brevis]
MDRQAVDDDVLMDDGEVVQSTEVFGANDQAFKKPGLGPYPKAPFSDGSRATPPLKGAGLKREPDDFTILVRKDGPRDPKFDALPYASAQTGLIYDVRMRFHVESDPEEDLHPEDPRRIHAIFEAFVNAGLVWRQSEVGPPSGYYMGRIDTRMVTKDEVCLVHTENHWNWVQSLSRKEPDELRDELQHPPHRLDSVYLSTSTPYCAGLSAGGAIEACRAIIMGKVKNVFAVIRPPGHHAEREDAKGFCFYDNVSIATKVCQKEFGDKCRKVLILDWDVHHGNGIQQANYSDPNVLYISLHVHKKGTFYPEKSYRDDRVSYGDHLHCGEGAGLGKNVNIPWSKMGMGDADYVYAFQQIVMPIAIEFNPDLVIIAAGFDAAEGDMLGGCKVTPAGYAHMTHMLMSLAKGKMAVCLEGGYNLDAIARSSCAVGRTMMGEPPDRLEDLAASRSGIDDVKQVLRQQSRFWASLHPKDPASMLPGPPEGERMHNVVRRWQADTMFNDYGMTPLYVHRERLAKEFENQVLATREFGKERPLLVILHDPPEMIASPDPRTGKVELHNTWLTYIDEAIKHKFGVIDVNLPKHIAEYDSTNQEHKESESTEARIAEATELLTYVWENYIELDDPTHVFLMGTNTGHGAILNFIKRHEDRAQKMITKAISFVEDVPLMSCKSPTNDYLPGWYHATSLVFVADQHNYFESEYYRKPKKRFGRVIRSQELCISDMLKEQRKAVFDCLLSETEEWRRTAPMEVVEAEPQVLSPSRLPPVGNFAPAARNSAAAVEPFRTSNGGTSPSGLPPMGNFASRPPHDR